MQNLSHKSEIISY